MDRFRTLTILLLCFALLAMRIDAAHLHLCFDGQEPSVSLHLADAGDVNEHSRAGLPHQDLNLDLNGSAFAKQSEAVAPVLALIFFAIVFALVDGARTAIPANYSIGPVSNILPRLRPPLRGPPLNSVV